MSGFGSMITFETGSLKNANRMLKKLRVCSLGRIAGRSGDADLASGDDDACGAG